MISLFGLDLLVAVTVDVVVFCFEYVFNLCSFALCFRFQSIVISALCSRFRVRLIKLQHFDNILQRLQKDKKR